MKVFTGLNNSGLDSFTQYYPPQMDEYLGTYLTTYVGIYLNIYLRCQMDVRIAEEGKKDTCNFVHIQKKISNPCPSREGWKKDVSIYYTSIQVHQLLGSAGNMYH